MIEQSNKFKKKYGDSRWRATYFDRKVEYWANTERQALQRGVELFKLKAKQKECLFVVRIS